MRAKSFNSSENCFVLNTGHKIPAVGLGTWQADGDICTEAVRTALEVGYRHLDCDHLYGNEVEVGQALSEALRGGLKREDVFVTSKLWCTTNAPKRVETSVKVCLKNLELSYLDLYLVHWPLTFSFGDATDPPRKPGMELRQPSHRLKATWQAMECLVEKGLVNSIGVSNFSIQQIEELLSFAKIIPAVNQVELHPFWRQDDLVKFCQAKGIHVSAHTPLGVPASNLLSNECGSSGEDECETPRIAFRRCRSVHVPMIKTSVVANIAARLNKTPEQVILRWGLQRGTSVLPRSLRPERIKTNFDIFNWSLSEEDWKKINSLEPQLRLIDSGYSNISEAGPLQAVQETDDDIEGI
ncbi:hypothetical protein SUGI_0696320 [Cryptomeria japonica]|uniref:aldo-keto reductase family 4 member C10 n=1 Tax=Cryptomeria japonica TaxID=3369 RepID=UPI002414BB26|nr:aldo-keto reductase family 4 member C10 [Cryptomeria japonica]GLJ34621.1 hypothetical protein SUGI_0696320 [Cryptomeria japonica]